MPEKIEIPIGGFLKQSLVDYPGNISAVVFTQGCNFRCRYCHNPELVYPHKIIKSGSIGPDTVKNWIKENRILLDAVVITGGEPTLHGALPGFLSFLKNLGLKTKLDTNGTNPLMLRSILQDGLADYVAMDIKAPFSFSTYQKIAGDCFTGQMLAKVKESAGLLMSSGVGYEFRTTLDELLAATDIKEIAREISGCYYLQDVRRETEKEGVLMQPRAGKLAAELSPNLGDKVKLMSRS